MLNNCRTYHQHHATTSLHDSHFKTFPHDVTHTDMHTCTHAHKKIHHVQKQFICMVVYSNIATLYRVNSSKGYRIHELQCNMCGIAIPLFLPPLQICGLPSTTQLAPHSHQLQHCGGESTQTVREVDMYL